MWHHYPVFLLSPGVSFIIAVLVIWSLIWKGLALWQAARNSDKGWYIAMLIINTAGLLEIIYLFFFAKKDTSIVSPKKSSK